MALPKPIDDPDILEGKPSRSNIIASVPHLAETVSHDHSHAQRHLQDTVRDHENSDFPGVAFNVAHAQKHLASCAEHVAKIIAHIKEHRQKLSETVPEDILNDINELAEAATEAYVKAQKATLAATKLIEQENLAKEDNEPDDTLKSAIGDHLHEGLSYLRNANSFTARLVDRIYAGPGFNTELYHLEAAHPGLKSHGRNNNLSESLQGMVDDLVGEGFSLYEASKSLIPQTDKNPNGSAVGPDATSDPATMTSKTNANIPPSKFAKNKEIPDISTEPPPKIGGKVNAEFALQHAARVLIQAEAQDDPTWLESHRSLVEQWLAIAQALMQYDIDRCANAGEAELKQQQIYQQHEMHQQSLAHNDQKHIQGMKRTDQQHQQQMKQGDAEHQFGMKTKDEQHQFDMSTRKDKAQIQKTQMTQKKPSPSPSGPKTSGKSPGRTTREPRGPMAAKKRGYGL